MTINTLNAELERMRKRRTDLPHEMLWTKSE